MEILQTIWTALTTPNQNLINYSSLFLTFIEVALTMLLFTTVLNISTARKQRIIYIVSLGVLGIINFFFVPSPFNDYINMLLIPILVYFLFERNILKALVSPIIPTVVGLLIQNFIVKFYLTNILTITFEIAFIVPIYRYSVMLITFMGYFVLYKLAKKFNFNIAIFENMNKKNKKLLIINSVFILIAIATQTYLTSFYMDNFSVGITSLSMISLLGYYVISIYSIANTTKLETTSQDLQVSNEYLKAMTSLYDNMKAFKHDLNNIVQTIGGYVVTKDMDGLNIYYKQLLEECHINNSLDALNPKAITHPAVYSIVASKYHDADDLGISMNLEIQLDLHSLNMKIYPFTRILGILLDNAIEAAKECEDKVINIYMRNEKNRQVLLIKNTYSNKDVDTEKIFKKGTTTKKDKDKPHGLGLWEVRKILNKSDNLNLYTSKDNEFFSQQLEMYKLNNKVEK